MFSAAIFTTNPLFAMDAELPETKGKSISYIYCPLCKPELKSEIFDKITDKEYFSILPKEIIIELIQGLPMEDVLAVSTTSKEMCNLFHTPLIWEHIAEREDCEVNPGLCVKAQVLTHHTKYLKLFSEYNKDIEYQVTIKQFNYFVQNPCPSTWWPFMYEKESVRKQSYCFSIGKNQFELYASNTNLTVEKALKNYKKMTFRLGYVGYYNDNACFVGGFNSAFCIKKLENTSEKK